MYVGYATINGKQYSSDDQPSFDVIVDGRPAAPPSLLAAALAGTSSVASSGGALRKANRLQLTAKGRTTNLLSKNIGQVLKPVDSPDNSCRSGILCRLRSHSRAKNKSFPVLKVAPRDARDNLLYRIG